MKNLIYALAITLAAFSSSIGYGLLERTEALSAENERLRLFHAREVRRQKKPPAEPRWAAIAKASHITGADADVIAAIWRHENGPPDIETGVLGRTDYFAKNFPIAEWPALETGRTINVWAWRWFTETPEGKAALKKMLVYASAPYTAKTNEKEWAKNVYAFTLEGHYGAVSAKAKAPGRVGAKK